MLTYTLAEAIETRGFALLFEGLARVTLPVYVDGDGLLGAPSPEPLSLLLSARWQKHQQRERREREREQWERKGGKAIRMPHIYPVSDSERSESEE